MAPFISRWTKRAGNDLLAGAAAPDPQRSSAVLLVVDEMEARGLVTGGDLTVEITSA